MSLPEKCVVCATNAPKTLEGLYFDGLCSECEMSWDNELLRLTKEFPTASLDELFAMATAATKEKYKEKAAKQ